MYQRELHIRCAKLLVALLFFCVCKIQAQDHDYIQYTTKDGLPTNYVYGVIEDDDGYIWAYTENGMSKFDGYTFQNFSTKDGLSGNDIVYALKDDEGKIWLQIYNGLPAYIWRDSVMTIADNTCPIMSLNNGKIFYNCLGNTSIYHSNGQTTFHKTALIDTFILKHGSQEFHLDSIVARQNGGNWQEQADRSPIIYESIDSVYYYSPNKKFIYKVTPHGYIFISTSSGKIYWKKNEQTKVIDSRLMATYKQSISIYIEQLGREEKCLAYYGLDGLFLFDAMNGMTINLNLKYNALNYNLNRGNINILKNSFLVSSQKGFSEFDFDGNLIDSVNLSGIAENYTLLRHFKDSKGNIWIGSREGGLFLIPKSRRKTQRLTSPFSKDKAFEHFYKTKNGGLLAVTDNTGIYKIDGLQTTQILKPNKNLRFRSGTNTPHGIILSSSGKSLVINERDNSFSSQLFNQRFPVLKNDYYQNLKKVRQTHLADNPNNRINMAYHEHNQTLFSSGSAHYISRHLIHRNKSEVKFTTFKASVLSYDSIRQDMYIGNPGGLFIFENEQILPFLEAETALKNISSLHADQQALWIGTENNGLYVYYFDSKKLSKKSNAHIYQKHQNHTCQPPLSCQQ